MLNSRIGIGWTHCLSNVVTIEDLYIRQRCYLFRRVLGSNMVERGV